MINSFQRLYKTELSADELEKIDAEHVWHHSVPMKNWQRNPLILSQGKGAVLKDIRGREYIDAISGVENVSLGQCNREIVDAIKEQIEKLAYSNVFSFSNIPQAFLAKRLADLLPQDLKRVFFITSGSEATETTLKIARQYWKQSGRPTKYKVISRWLSYHGATYGAVAMTATPFRTKFEPLPSGFIHVFPPYCYRCPFEKSYPECEVICARIIKNVVEFETSDTIASLIAEPVQITALAPVVVPPPEYFCILREICNENNVFLVFDEVATGFGRTGRLFAFEHWDVVPDLIALGKGITGGHLPLSAVVARSKIVDAFYGEAEEHMEFKHVHTYGGYPAGCAAALAAIELMVNEKLANRSADKGAYLLRELSDLKEDSAIVGDVRGLGLLVGIEFVKDKKTKKPFSTNKVITSRVEERAREKGVLIRGGGPLAVTIHPALTIQDELLEKIITVVREAIEEVEKEVT